MEPTQGCSFDALEVFSGDSTDVNNRLAKLCGNELPDPIVSTSHELLIRFRSDFSVTNRGFKLQYEDTGILVCLWTGHSPPISYRTPRFHEMAPTLSNLVALPDLYFCWALWPASSNVIRVKDIIWVVSSIVSFLNHRPTCLEWYSLSQHLAYFGNREI